MLTTYFTTFYDTKIFSQDNSIQVQLPGEHMILIRIIGLLLVLQMLNLQRSFFGTQLIK